ncbi:MAG: hypothetical protein ACXWUC_09305, partial [Methylosarcina sp.]
RDKLDEFNNVIKRPALVHIRYIMGVMGWFTASSLTVAISILLGRKRPMSSLKYDSTLPFKAMSAFSRRPTNTIRAPQDLEIFFQNNSQTRRTYYKNIKNSR